MGRFKKARTYGTIIVDQETGRPLEVLSDRTAETLAAWLELHPEIQVVTRERATEYERGVSLGAPQATQVRWHLLKNLRHASGNCAEGARRSSQRGRSRLSSGASFYQGGNGARRSLGKTAWADSGGAGLACSRDEQQCHCRAKASRTFVRRSINLEALEAPSEAASKSARPVQDALGKKMAGGVSQRQAIMAGGVREGVEETSGSIKGNGCLLPE